MTWKRYLNRIVDFESEERCINSNTNDRITRTKSLLQMIFCNCGKSNTADKEESEIEDLACENFKILRN